MMQKSRPDPARLAEALGASRTVSLPNADAQGPLGLLQLRADVQNRLRSSGGRPTDAEWTLKRSVPFRPERWEELERLAAQLTTPERAVSPAQLAAFLIELKLAELEREVAEGDEHSLQAVFLRTG